MERHKTKPVVPTFRPMMNEKRQCVEYEECRKNLRVFFLSVERSEDFWWEEHLCIRGEK
jgi:hypothetical protein